MHIDKVDHAALVVVVPTQQVICTEVRRWCLPVPLQVCHERTTGLLHFLLLHLLLGLVHRVLGYPTAYPVSVPGVGATRAYITVVGVEPGTSVTIKTSTPTKAAPGFSALAQNGQITVTLNAFDVFNLESDGNPGDFTGSVVVANKPVGTVVGADYLYSAKHEDLNGAGLLL